MTLIPHITTEARYSNKIKAAIYIVFIYTLHSALTKDIKSD